MAVLALVSRVLAAIRGDRRLVAQCPCGHEVRLADLDDDHIFYGRHLTPAAVEFL